MSDAACSEENGWLGLLKLETAREPPVESEPEK
jgi:hypothetical protein